MSIDNLLNITEPITHQKLLEEGTNSKENVSHRNSKGYPINDDLDKVTNHTQTGFYMEEKANNQDQQLPNEIKYTPSKEGMKLNQLLLDTPNLTNKLKTMKHEILKND